MMRLTAHVFSSPPLLSTIMMAHHPYSESRGAEDIETISDAGTENKGHRPKQPRVTHGSGNSTADPVVEDYDALDAKMKG